MHEDDRMKLVVRVAEALMAEWFPSGIRTDDRPDWESAAMLDAEVAVDTLIGLGRIK